MGAIDTTLVVNAAVVAPLVGKAAPKVDFDEQEPDIILNRHELWKLHDKLPSLSAIDQLEAVKHGLNTDLRFLDFDYLPFLQSCVILVDQINEELDDLRYTGLHTLIRRSAPDKLRYIMLYVLAEDDPSLFSRIAHVLDTWLQSNGSSGQINPIIGKEPGESKDWLRKRSDLIALTKNIVRRRGLSEGIFTEEQLQVLGVEATHTFEGRVKELWTAQKDGGKK